MAKRGDRFRMPDGNTYIVTRSAAETGGESIEMEFILPPKAVAPPPHIHPQQVEEYEVLEGSFDVMVDGHWRTLWRVGLGSARGAPHLQESFDRGCPRSQLAQARRPLRGLHRARPRDPADRGHQEPTLSARPRLPLDGHARVRRHARAWATARATSDAGPGRARTVASAPHLLRLGSLEPSRSRLRTGLSSVRGWRNH